MVAYVRPLKIELRENVVSWSILVRFWRLIARNLAVLSSFLAVNPLFYEAWINNDVSTGSLSGYEKDDFW